MNRGRIVRTMAICLLLALPATFAGQPSRDEIRKILVDRIDQAKQSVGIVVGMIDESGQIVVGYGGRGTDIDGTPDGGTVFEIGSATKVFTAILLADMMLREQVSGDDPVARHLPDTVKLPDFESTPITLMQLTTHTSGLPRMPDNFAPADPANPYADYSVEQLYEFLSGHELERKPGGEPAYSNLGVGLLGHTLTLIADTGYESLVKQKIAGPLGMSDTSMTLSDAQRERLAYGHDQSLTQVANWDIPTLAGAGALRSTVNDMLKFVAANLGLVKTEIAAAMQETHRPRQAFGSEEVQIAMGWIVTKKHGRAIHWHNGGTGGYHSFVGMDRSSGQGVVVLSNSVHSIDDIGFHLLEPEFELAAVNEPGKTAEIPDSPAGNSLKGWLEALRSGDDEIIGDHFEENFSSDFKKSVPADQYLAFSGQIRPLLSGNEIETVIVRSDHDLTAYLDSGGNWFAIHIQVSGEKPPLILGLLVRPESPPKE